TMSAQCHHGPISTTCPYPSWNSDTYDHVQSRPARPMTSGPGSHAAWAVAGTCGSKPHGRLARNLSQQVPSARVGNGQSGRWPDAAPRVGAYATRSIAGANLRSEDEARTPSAGDAARGSCETAHAGRSRPSSVD